jgi:hypothetical protein
MPEGVLLDNDVVLKLSIYQATDDMIEATTLCGIPPSILGIARFTLRSHVLRSRTIRDRESVSAVLQRTLGILNRVEPNDDELELAGDLEQRAIESGLELDAGESQLFAIMIKRHAPLLITGDKRAIRALCRLAPDSVTASLACLEQLVASVVSVTDHNILRARVCAEPDTDRAMTAIFACFSAAVALPDVMIGLRSYINSLRKEAERLLIASDDLSAIIP